jgi:hemin uptake protein HemP
MAKGAGETETKQNKKNVNNRKKKMSANPAAAATTAVTIVSSESIIEAMERIIIQSDGQKTRETLPGQSRGYKSIRRYLSSSSVPEHKRGGGEGFSSRNDGDVKICDTNRHERKRERERRKREEAKAHSYFQEPGKVPYRLLRYIFSPARALFSVQRLILIIKP